MIRWKFRAAIVACLWFVAFGTSAQTAWVADGEVVAHDIRQEGVMPDALRALLGNRPVQSCTSGQLRSRKAMAQSIRRGQAAATSKTIGPLLQSIRAQEEPYNLLCPHWTDKNGNVSEAHCLSGCVATSIEQVLAYYRYPEETLDTLHGWETDNYIIEDMLPGTRFDWDNYLLDYRNGWTTEQGMAIALPTLAAGMAVHMNYGLSSSGADTEDALEPLRRVFGYGMTCYRERVLYSAGRWHELLCHELKNGRPIVYTGHNMELHGHAFNIDGVDERGFYHVNWGFDGNYDGWYDLDWLCPFEAEEHDPNGLAEGCFCNQTALLMHPSAEAKPLEPDSLSLDKLGVELKNITFLREPDLQGYVAADFDFLNTSEDSVAYTYEVITWLPTDTAIFMQADYVGLSCIYIAPHERRTQRVYLHFRQQGSRLLGISHDDVTIPYQTEVQIAKGTRPKLVWGSVTAECIHEDSLNYTFHIPVTNTATSGVAGDLVTVCLYADDEVDCDRRHFPVLSLPAGESQTLSVTFSSLRPDTHYTLIVRCPWEVQTQTDFVTPIPSAIHELAAKAADPESLPVYDISGRPAAPSIPGQILISSRRKWLNVRK